MKTLFYKNNEVILEELPIPRINSGEILVQTAYSAISIGSELFAVSESSLGSKAKKKENISKLISTVKEKGIISTVGKIFGAMSSEQPLGYGLSGRVVEVGSGVSEFKVGDLVSCMGMGKAVHGEYVAVPKNLAAKLPNNFTDLKSASFGAIGCITLNAVRQLHPQLGETVMVQGCGLLGLVTTIILKNAGVKVICVDVNAERVQLAKKIEADEVFLAGDDAMEREIMAMTNSKGVDGLIVAAGGADDSIINQALPFLKNGGKIVLLGKAPIHIDYNLAFKKDIKLYMARSYGPGRYDLSYEEKGIDYPFEYVRWTQKRNLEAFLELLREKNISLEPIISKEVSISDAPQLFRDLMKGGVKCSGAIISYPLFNTEVNSCTVVHTKYNTTVVPGDKKIRAGIIGLGDFSKNTLLPILGRISDFEIRAIANRKPYDLPRSARLYKSAYYTTDAEEILKDPAIDVVFINTPNNTHAQFVLDSVSHGKVCVVEKPLCITQKELQTLQERTKNGPEFFVGFNRRYAPLTQEMKKITDKLSGPTIIEYSVNAGFMDPQHWMQDLSVGGGRWISEGCHFVDFGYFITGARKMMSYTTSCIPVNNTTVLAKDNYFVDITFDEGSVMRISYTSIGNKSYPKEFVRVTKNGHIFEIVDFKEFIHASDKGVSRKTLAQIDKGHENQYREVAKFLRGENSAIITQDEIFVSSESTIDIARSL